MKVNMVAMCEVRFKKKNNKEQTEKKQYSGQKRKEMDCDEPV